MGFLILFPIFLIYQSLVQFGYISPFLGGYFTFGSLVALPFAIYSFLKIKKKKLIFNSYVIIGYFIFLLYFLFFTFIGYVNSADSEIVTASIATLLRSISIFFVILCFNPQSKINDLALKAFFVAYSFVILIFSNNDSFVSRGLEINGSIFQIDYQTTAVVYILFLIYTAPTLSLRLRILFYGMTLPSLFYIGARSELVGIIPLIFVIEFLLSKSALRYSANMFLFGVAFLTAGYAFYAEYSDSRIFNLLNIGSDASGIARLQFSVQALETIATHPFFGNFASYSPGEYSHNILSVWVDFGIFGFALFLTVLFLQAVFLVRRYRSGDVSVHFVRVASVFSIMLIMIITSKSYSYTMIPICMAFYAIHRRALRLKIINSY